MPWGWGGQAKKDKQEDVPKPSLYPSLHEMSALNKEVESPIESKGWIRTIAGATVGGVVTVAGAVAGGTAKFATGVVRMVG